MEESIQPVVNTFLQQPYQISTVTDVVPDAMHTIAVCMEHILSLITGKESDDSVSVRNAEKAFNRFPECWVESNYKDHTGTDLQPGIRMEEGRSHGKIGTKRKHSDSTKGKKSESSSSTRHKLPSAPFRLTPKDLKIADQRASQITVPVDCSFKPGPFFSKLTRLNSHAFKEVSFKLSSVFIYKCYNITNKSTIYHLFQSKEVQFNLLD